MNIVQITPGAGGMYCGNCFRDNALVRELRVQGHQVTMLPMYLPMTLDETDQSIGAPIFFGGINVYLEQKLPWLGRMPEWLHRSLSAPGLLKWAAGRAARTRAADLGDLTLSMLRGEEGNQVRELEKLIAWLKTGARPQVVCLSNALLVGLSRSLKRELDVPVVCTLQGEDSFLDSLPESHREKTWQTLAERAREIDLFIAPSQYFADRMSDRLQLQREKVRVVYNGIDPQGFSPAPPPNPPVLGYFARMCREKGLHLVVEAFMNLRKRGRVPNLKLHVGGGMGPSDEPLVKTLQTELAEAGLGMDVSWFPNLDRQAKQNFFRGLSVFSVPAVYGEAFGLYLLEAWASGVPAVQPPLAAFPELLQLSGAGVLAASAEPQALASAIEGLLLDGDRRAALAHQARIAVEEKFNQASMARNIITVFEPVAAGTL